MLGRKQVTKNFLSPFELAYKMAVPGAFGKVASKLFVEFISC